MVPHTHKSGEDRAEIPMYLRFPKQQAKGKVPAVLLFTGLDGYRPDNTQRSEEFINRGWAAVIVEIPGTADCPADPKDPEGSERLWDSVLDWMEKDGRFDMGKVLVWD
jgi:dienelactone hydrolase